MNRLIRQLSAVLLVVVVASCSGGSGSDQPILEAGPNDKSPPDRTDRVKKTVSVLLRHQE